MTDRRLTWLLRHGGIGEGFQFDTEGYTSVKQILHFLQISRDQLEQIVNADSKTRFTLLGDRIRANQGHSHSIGTQINHATFLNFVPHPQTLIVHGTYQNLLFSIQTHGLSRMSRTMIHMCEIDLGEPTFEGLRRLVENVKSGVRRNCNLYIIIDHVSAMRDGIKFYRSTNGVILSEGVNGVIPPKYLQFITR